MSRNKLLCNLNVTATFKFSKRKFITWRRVEDSNPCGLFNPPRFERGALPLCQPSLRFAQGKLLNQSRNSVIEKFTLSPAQRDEVCAHPDLNWELILRRDVLYPIKLWARIIFLWERFFSPANRQLGRPSFSLAFLEEECSLLKLL